jgi:dTDP-4-amino-4,6-dideoxygalactose transaminase
VTNHAEFADRARMLRDHGRRDKYLHQIVGYGYRLDALQAAILGAKLPHLEVGNARRRAIADYYTELLTNLDIVPPYVPSYITPVYHIYCIRAHNRDGLQSHLKQRGIESGIHYPIPLHLQLVYQNLGYHAGDFPHAEQAANDILSLPMYPEMTDAQVQQVVDAVKEFYRQ